MTPSLAVSKPDVNPFASLACGRFLDGTGEVDIVGIRRSLFSALVEGMLGCSVWFGPGGRAAGMVRVAECGVNGGRRGQHVSGMAERWQVAHVWHVACQGAGAAKRRGLVLHALGELLETLTRSFTPLGLAGHLAVACLDALLLHGQWPVDVVEFVVEPAGVAHRVTVPVAPPQGGRGCLAVRAAGASSPRRRQSALWLDKGSVLAVHLVVQAARVAEVVARSIPPPQRGGGGSTVHTFTPLCAEF